MLDGTFYQFIIIVVSNRMNFRMCVMEYCCCQLDELCYRAVEYFEGDCDLQGKYKSADSYQQKQPHSYFYFLCIFCLILRPSIVLL